MTRDRPNFLKAADNVDREAARIDAAAQEALEKVVNETQPQANFNFEMMLIRFAAVLNMIDVAKSHAGHADWGVEHAREVINMLRISDKVVSSDGGALPQGFGPVQRTHHAALVAKLADEARDSIAKKAVDDYRREQGAKVDRTGHPYGDGGESVAFRAMNPSKPAEAPARAGPGPDRA